MPQSLRSILGSSNRVRKPSRSSPSTKSLSRQSSTLVSPGPSPRKRAASSSSRPKTSNKNGDDDDDIFSDRLEDTGIAKLLAEELTLRDVIQAMRYIRSTMFTPIPDKGFTSSRMAEIRSYRLSLPEIVTTGHINSVLQSPTKVEREVAHLQRSGLLRKFRISCRGAQGEALMETSSLTRIIQSSSSSLRPETRDALTTLLQENPATQIPPPGSLTNAQADELIRAGLLISVQTHVSGSTLHIRPEDRTMLTSISRISQHASGSVSAVGGQGAIHLAGGGSGSHPALLARPLSSSSSSDSDLRLAIPGHGRYLKLAAASVDWVREALGRTRWGECPESWLRERFEGGGLYGPRWKTFWGVEWGWVLGEAVGLGVVEVFDTGSVGRGVRALSG